MEQQFEERAYDSDTHAQAQELELDGAPSLAAASPATETAAGSGVSSGALASATEGGLEGGGQTASEQALGAAPGAIDAQRAAAARQRFTQREQARAKETAQRNQGRLKVRQNGELVDRPDWTEEELRRRFGAKGVGLFTELNERKPQQGITVLKQINLWDPLIAKLPRGGMHRNLRIALDQMVADEVVTLEDMIKLFLYRFNHAAEETSGHWTVGLMKGMWRQLSMLPPQDIKGNTVLTTFQAISGGGGFGPSWEAPDQISTIQIGEDNIDSDYLEHTVRHEVGHGVHAQISGPINSWLQNDMEFWFTDWDTWIQDLGGYPDKFWHAPSNQWVPVDDAWKGALREVVRSFTGHSSWSPTRATPEEGQHPDVVAAWQAMPLEVKNALQQSTPHWYNNYANFQPANGKRYFVNHWYQRPFRLGDKAYNTIAATNETYTAMSEAEFFANCYAEYFADPAGVHDQSKWGGTLPSDVKAFFKTCIVQRHPYTTFQKKQGEAKAG